MPSTCQHCGQPMAYPDPRQRYCSARCTNAAWNSRRVDQPRQPATEPEDDEDLRLAPSSLTVTEVKTLIADFRLPQPFILDPLTDEPLWRYRELAELFGVSEVKLREILISNGQPFMEVSIGTSARMLTHG